MTNEDLWSAAKWIYKHNGIHRSFVPKRLKALECKDYGLFQVECAERDADGYPIMDRNDIYIMLDRHVDAFNLELKQRRADFRNWIEPIAAVVATIISLIALIISIIALRLSL